MANYRCYFLDEDDLIHSAEWIEAAGLDAAIDLALGHLRARRRGLSIELWQGTVRLYASRRQAPRHQCLVYKGAPSRTLHAMAEMIKRKLSENIRCLYINSPTMIAGLRSSLAALDVEVEKQVERGALELSSDQSHLQQGRFDGRSMLLMLEDAVKHALEDGYAGLWATGDMGWELGSHGELEDLLEYERGLEQVFRRRPELSGVCQYHVDVLPPDVVEIGLSAHRSVFVNETLSRLNPQYVAADGVPNAHLALGTTVEELLEESLTAGS